MGTRGRSMSPFPNAFKLLVELENEGTSTIIQEADVDLLEACAHKGRTCVNCKTIDELAVGWLKIVSIREEDGTQKESWVCKLCSAERSPQRYSYSSSDLSNSEEVMSFPSTKRKQRRPR